MAQEGWQENAAHEIEMKAANLSYKVGFGVSEWEAFLTDNDTVVVESLTEIGD